MIRAEPVRLTGIESEAPRDASQRLRYTAFRSAFAEQLRKSATRASGKIRYTCSGKFAICDILGQWPLYA
jgi:hypothetical protein